MPEATSTHSAGGGRASLTSFVGRRRELSEVKNLMSESRLVTLTGPGGVGKTRIALEVADRSRRGLRDGVWIAELASLEDESRLAQAIVSALHVPDQSNRPPEQKLISYLRERQLLIVLDNCEHLLDVCAALVEVLLNESPGLRVLATSREPLGIGGEHLCVIPPLSSPPAQESHTAKAIAHYEAVSLLVDRARNVLPDFTVTDENVEAVVQLCDRLDGIPLAIELAATRLRSLSVTQIVHRLDKRFSLLAGGNRMAMPRQQTLRALIDWSFDLCTQSEQLLWARLSIFPGTFDLDAVEEICGFGALDPELIIDLLDRLVAKSIILTERTGESVRYRQLMTVREYGSELLGASGEYQQLKGRHRDHFLRKAAIMVDRWCGPGQAAALAVMKADHASLLSALEWSASSPPEIGSAAELASLLRYHWVAGGFLSDGRRWLDQILSGTVEPAAQRGNALWVAAWIALMQGDRHAAAYYLSECESVAAALEDSKLSAHAMQWSAIHLLFSGDTGEAIKLFRRCIDVHTRFGDTASVLTGLFQLAMAQTYHPELDAALQTCRRAIKMSKDNGEQWNRTYALWITGLCHWRLGEMALAKKAALQALTMQREFKDSICTALTVELLSWIASSTADFKTAAELAGAATAVWTGLGTDVQAFGPHLYADSTTSAASVMQHLGDRTVSQLARQNASMTIDDAVGLALGHSSPRRIRASVKSPLTKRETQIANLVADGMSNRAIAEMLVLSTRTIDGHVERILAKLDFASRAQIASWIATQKTHEAS
ncbi:LuxR C-terminal-related transcriptional regulator [Aldersonia sp. NBC_00410]|uniref:ATP-binding protein n=1 Tax=Aldersonia sp. NBC_00410 TaxID=2975954 RepID=UPI00225B5141|nr:LuxR C-terminal-related transcriptional regulator [Aldersonia sp. NBC_00410]MCX5042365.1 LuxR C-terminal-related transcriptional regulator [Aldersonia sp. NBC_00410]MCX5042388.1 LuxR C-terminal-related transcriptional regulator [Aldersonia sp. NBC_00410]